jgi:hypothetical protein
LNTEPAEIPRRVPARPRRSPFAVTPLGAFAAAFMFVMGAATAVAMGQFTASRLAPWLSIGYSAAAVACTMVALLRRPHP